jgi:hypothetical protein
MYLCAFRYSLFLKKSQKVTHVIIADSTSTSLLFVVKCVVKATDRDSLGFSGHQSPSSSPSMRTTSRRVQNHPARLKAHPYCTTKTAFILNLGPSSTLQIKAPPVALLLLLLLRSGCLVVGERVQPPSASNWGSSRTPEREECTISQTMSPALAGRRSTIDSRPCSRRRGHLFSQLELHVSYYNACNSETIPENDVHDVITTHIAKNEYGNICFIIKMYFLVDYPSILHVGRDEAQLTAWYSCVLLENGIKEPP